MRMYDLNTELSALEVLPPAVRTADVNGSGVDLRGYHGKLKMILDSAAGTGTTPTLDAKVQDSADNVTFTDVAGLTFTQVTDAGPSLQSIGVDTRSVKRYIRVVGTKGGGTPSFTYAVLAVGQKQTS